MVLFGGCHGLAPGRLTPVAPSIRSTRTPTPLELPWGATGSPPEETWLPDEPRPADSQGEVGKFLPWVFVR